MLKVETRKIQIFHIAVLLSFIYAIEQTCFFIMPNLWCSFGFDLPNAMLENSCDSKEAKLATSSPPFGCAGATPATLCSVAYK